MTRILIIDDEPQIRRFLKASLEAHEYEVIEAGNVAEALRALTTARPDLAILDLGLPDQDGMEVLRNLRGWSGLPVIVLSVRADDSDKIAALDSGANDYMTKPFSMAELLARIRAALRGAGEAEPASEAVFGDLVIDRARRMVTRAGRRVELSPKEYDLLCYLAAHAGKVVTHRQALVEIWGPAQAEEVQYLRVYIGQLRRKLEADPANPVHILTEPGVGYRMDAPKA